MWNRRATAPLLILMAAASAGAGQMPPGQGGGSALKPCVSGGGLYVIYKPADWKVAEELRDDSLRVIVQSPDGASMADFFWARNAGGKPDALWFLSAFCQMLRQRHPDASLSEVYASRDSARAMATVRYGAGPGAAKGRYYFESAPDCLSAQGYCAPESRLESDRPLLLNIMASLAFNSAKTPAPGQPDTTPPQVQHVRVPLVPRRAADGSLTMKAPADWSFLAQAGRVVTGSPDGGSGFIFTVFTGNPMAVGASIAQGVIASQYLPPAQTMASVFRAFGNRDFAVRSAQPDTATARAFPSYVGRQCDAQDMVVAWASPGGVACVGAFKVINALPSVTGMWFSIVAGMWGPELEFARYFPMLEEVASSFSIDDRYARTYIQAGLENLRRLRQKTADAMRDLGAARERGQSDWEARQARKDYMDSKWDDYRRGNSYWVSDMEGGKAYRTDNWGTQDGVTGDYYEGKPYNWVNFEGRNPSYPSETMREVSGYELQQVQGGRR